MMLKKMLSIYLLCCINLLCGGVYAKPAEHKLDHIFAVVNDDVITKSELTRALDRAKTQIAQENLPVPPEPVLEKQVSDQLINKMLQLQLASSLGVQITQEELDKVIQRIADQNHVTMTELYKHINHDGLSTKEYRQEISDQVTLQKLQQQEVAGKITVTPEEATTFLHSRAWQANTGKEFRLDDILISLPENPSPQQIAKAKERAELVLVKLEQGKNFRKLAQWESGDSRALKGGDLGWRQLPEIPAAFTEQVTHMQAKEISGPIQTANGFHIIRLAGVRSLKTPQTPPDAKQIEGLLLQQKLEDAVQSWVSKLRAQAFIKTNSTQV